MTDSNTYSDKYTKYCRPKLGKLLNLMRIDKSFYRAEGDYLYYIDDNQKEVAVLDFLGGYGASMFGHNDNELIKEAKNCLNDKIPFNSQASVRLYTPQLCEKLHKMMLKRFEKKFYVNFANTGTEIVESAIKHSEFFSINKIEKIQDSINSAIYRIQRSISDKEYNFDASFHEFLAQELHLASTEEITLQQFFSLIKMHNAKQFSTRPFYLSLGNSFHGKTSGAVRLTYNEEYRKPFERIGIDVLFVNNNEVNKAEYKNVLDKASLFYYIPTYIDDKLGVEKKLYVNISGFFVEPIQGEGGINIVPKKVIRYIREFTNEYQIPLIFDEIQSGMGRTGTFLFSEQYGITGDYYLLSKSLGGGLAKIAVMLVEDSMYIHEYSKIHTSTFAEDDFSSSIALKALSILEQDNSAFMKSCKIKGSYIIKGLKEIQKDYPTIINDIRGMGLMIGIQFHQQDNSSPFLCVLSESKMLGYVIAGYMFHEHNIRVAPTLSDNFVIRIEPSGYISEAACNKLFKAIRRLSEVLYKKNIYQLCRFLVHKENTDPDLPIKDCRLKSKAYSSNKKNVKRVGFIGHLLKTQDINIVENGFVEYSDEEIHSIFNKLRDFSNPVIVEKVKVSSSKDVDVELIFIVLPFSSDIISADLRSRNTAFIYEKIKKAVNMAVNEGCSMVGLGGLTSVIAHNGTRLRTDKISITTGNSLTVWMGYLALLDEIKKEKLNPKKLTFAAVGAAGNIASMYCELIAGNIPNIILIGRPKSELKLIELSSSIYLNIFKALQLQIHDKANENDMLKTLDKIELNGIGSVISKTKTFRELMISKDKHTNKDLKSILYKGISAEMKDSAPIKISTDIYDIHKADLILAASNSPTPVIYPDMLNDDKPTIICDIAAPHDVAESVKERCKKAKVIKGGLVKLPVDRDFALKGIDLDPGVSLACVCETLLLGLEDYNKNFSYGRLSKSKIKLIAEIAKQHNFTLYKPQVDIGL